MYPVADKDVVVSLEDVPQSSVGSPRPAVVATEHDVVLGYYVESPEIWSLSGDQRNNANMEEPFAIVLFKTCPGAHIWTTER